MKTKLLILGVWVFGSLGLSYAQVRVPGVLTNGGNAYPVAPAGMISGASQIVADMTALSNSPSWLREIGQEFHVLSPASDWRLVGGTNNSSWVEVVGSLTAGYNDFTTKADGAVGVADSGQTFILTNTLGYTSSAFRITNGMLMNYPTDNVSMGAYASIYSSVPVTRITANLNFDASAGYTNAANSGALLIGWETNILFINNPNPVPNTDCHVFIGPFGYQWGFFTNNTFTSGSVVLWSPGFVWGTNTHHVEIVKFSGYGVVIGPDGVAYRETDSRIGTIDSYYPCWEAYQDSNATNHIRTRFSAVSFDVEPNIQQSIYGVQDLNSKNVSDLVANSQRYNAGDLSVLGTVGIGITNQPGFALVVHGRANANLVVGGGGQESSIILADYRDGFSSVGFVEVYNAIAMNGLDVGTADFSYDTTGSHVHIGPPAGSTTNQDTFIQAYGWYATNYNNLFMQVQGGNVGIGTSNATEKFTVAGNITASGNLNITGNAGIGTALPVSKLDVRGGISAATTDYAAGSAGSLVQIGQTAGTGNVNSYLQAYTFGAGAYGNIGLNPNGGNVGIGMTTPAAKLDVSGDILTAGNLLFEGATADGFETALTVTDPTADRTVTFQNASGTVAYLSDISAGGGTNRYYEAGEAFHWVELGGTNGDPYAIKGSVASATVPDWTITYSGNVESIANFIADGSVTLNGVFGGGLSMPFASAAVMGSVSDLTAGQSIRVDAAGTGFEAYNTLTNTAQFDTDNADIVLGTAYTNSARRLQVFASFQLNAAAAGTAKVTVYSILGTTTNKLTISAGPLASLTTTEPLTMRVQPGGYYYYADETSGTGATAAFLAGTHSRFWE